MSTATALFTLNICGRLTDANRQLSRGFIFDHWQESGGFSGNIIDNHSDCEYTFYGLLAAGAII
jgi:prenyltransferase beta subunit